MKSKALLSLLLIAATASANPMAHIWLDHCSRCHGDAGKADTPLGRSLKISDYSSKEVQSKITDEIMFAKVANGNLRNGKQVMPVYKDLLTKEEIAAMVKYVRTLAKY